MKKLLAIVVVALLAVAAAACGGGGEEGGVTTPTASPRATATPSATATPAAGAPFGRLASVKSFRYTLRMELKGLPSLFAEGLGELAGEEVEAPETVVLEARGAFAGPDKAETYYRITGLDEEFGVIVIGKDQWVKLGDLVLGPNPLQGSIEDIVLPLSFWDEGFVPEAGTIGCSGEAKETVNGVPSRRCRIDQATFRQLASLFGGPEEEAVKIDSLSFDVWLHEKEGWPVRLRTQISGSDETGQKFDVRIEMDVTDVGKEIKISPPTT